MNAISLRGLLSRKLRTVLTAVAIILGVSMISGTYVLTDTINQSFASIFQQADRPIDAVVSSHQPVQSYFSLPPPIPASLLTTVKNTPGVAAAEGEIADQAQLVDSKNKILGSTSGAPVLLYSVPLQRFQRMTIVSGHEPSGQQIAVDQTTASHHHLRLGQVLGVSTIGPVRRFTLVGITKFGSVGSIGGATLISMDLATAQRVTGKVGKFDQIAVAGDSGVSHAVLAQRLKARIPPSLRHVVQVKTSEQATNDQTNSISDALSFLTIALLAFGGIAVFVGAFIIFNTFSITVAQRAREFALLRTLGATRAQVLRSVILEALLVGILSSILGLFGGIGVSRALNGLFTTFGIDLPNTGLVLLTRTIVVALLVGTIVTLVASIMPAVRATRVPPIAALREGATLPKGRWSRYTPFIAGLLTLAAIGLLAGGIFANISSTGTRLLIIGLGAIVLFLGVAMLSPQLVRPLASVIGWPMERLTHITGRLARENAMRNPSRTAVTAAALMIGLALVGFVTIFAAELRQTADSAVNRELVGDFAVYNQVGLMPDAVAPALRRIPGVATVSAGKLDLARVDGMGTQQTNGIQPATLPLVAKFQWVHGSNAILSRMGPHDILVDKNFSNDHHATLGTRLRLTTPAGRHDTFIVAGVYKTSQFIKTLSVRYDTFARDWQSHQDDFAVVKATPGVNLKTLKARMDSMLQANFPTAQAYSQQQIKDQSDKQVNQLLALIYVLLAMSVIVSLFGIINTLVLSVYERTREIGMLRAIGTTRSQVRWIIRWESVITAVIGAILGLLLGIVLAVLITAGLQDQGIEYALPLGQLLIWVVFAIFFGIVAAAFPARRAARLDVLQAVAYE